MTMLAPIRMSPRPRASAMQAFAMEGMSTPETSQSAISRGSTVRLQIMRIA